MDLPKQFCWLNPPFSRLARPYAGQRSDAPVSFYETIVIGLGNPILGDDGVGWKVAEEVRKQLPPNLPIDEEFLSIGGISLFVPYFP